MKLMNGKLLYLLLVLSLGGCSGKISGEQILQEWIGKTIVFPNIEPVYIQKTDTKDTTNHEYKILNYMDSTGCTVCRLNMSAWKTYIEEMGGMVDFLFYFQSANKKAIVTLLNRERFINYPVYIDTADRLNQMNKLPDNSMFQCFLLDKNNKVLAIGNPASNPKIRDLYKKIITGEISYKPLIITTIEVEQNEIELNRLHIDKTSEAVFVLKNTGTNPLVIQQVESSCGCTVPDWEKQPIAAGKSTEIRIKITPEKSEYFNKTVTVHCNIEKERISLKIKGVIED
jgi:hypothetical protein